MMLALAQLCSYLGLDGFKSSQIHFLSCVLPPPAPAETKSLLVNAARCHSPEPSVTHEGLSEKTLLLFCSRMGRESWRGKQRRTLSLSEATDPLRCCFLLRVLPPPPAREAQPNDGKVIHHWSTTAANWISPPPINMQSGLAKVSRKGWGGAAGMKVGRGVSIRGLQRVGESPSFPAWGSLWLLGGRWDLLSSDKSSVTPLPSSADLSSAIDTIWSLSALPLLAYWQVLMTVTAASQACPSLGPWHTHARTHTITQL